MTDEQKKNVLIAEDDTTYANVYKTKLSNAGYDVAVVGDCEKLLERMRERLPDLVVLDLIMPGKDGFATLEEIKNDEALKHVPVLVFSNLGQEEDIRRVRDMGAEEYLVKSELSVQEMVDAISKYV